MSQSSFAPTMPLSGERERLPMRLRGRWLVVARVVWLIFAASGLLQVVFGAPREFALYLAPCAAECEGSLLTITSARQLQELGLSMTTWALYAVGLELFFVGAWSTVACLIFWRKGDEPVAWLVSLTLLAFGHAFPGFTQVLWQFDQNPFWMLLAAPIIAVAVCGIVIFLYIFPDGRFVPRWTRWLSLAWALFTVYTLAATGLQGSELYFDLYYLALAIGLGSQIYRYRRVADQIQRQQTKWVVFGISAALAIFLSLNMAWLMGATVWGGDLLTVFLSQTIIYLCMSLIPLSIDIAIFRARLWDIDVIIGRALVYGALTACIIGIYVLVVGYLGLLFQTGGNLAISLVATGLVAVLFQPLREWLQRSVNRLLYGDRDDPYAVFSRLGQRLEATLAPEAVLPTIVESVAETLRLPYVAIALLNAERRSLNDEQHASAFSDQHAAFDVIASFGEPPTGLSHLHLVTLSLSYGGEQIGELRLAPRPGEGDFSASDRRLLTDLARQAGAAAHAVRLTAALQRSRERLVAAREEERRRLRRDLHDGLGPQLATLTLKLDAARNLIDRDPVAADALLADLKTQAQASIADIRRLVYELRPPALDELGLLGALRQQVAQYQFNQLRVTIDAPEMLPALPAAVEVAAYRIALEALTNVIRHAQARSCAISLGVGRGLSLDIRDDGQGLPPDYLAGVGLHSMRERAAELGGRCEIGPAPGGGTCVVAWLPLP